MQGTFGANEDPHMTQDDNQKAGKSSIRHDYLQRVAYQGESPNMSF